MKVELKKVKVRDLYEGFRDCQEEGVFGFSGKLNIRPPYQREFVYENKEQKAVIRSINQGFPLNTMYWAVCEDGVFEVLDGQQRTLSICNFLQGNFSLDDKRHFYNLTTEEKNKILDYELMVYFCEGPTKNKLDWFEVINTGGKVLTKQELRNAVFSGPFITEAKRWFSRTNCPAYNIGKDFIKGSPIRQDFLETAIDWISGGNIEDYMARHQHDTDATELWDYYRGVINWVKAIFPTTRKQMQSVDWGTLYASHGRTHFDPEVLESRVKELLMDEDVTKQAGIYPYLITGEEKWLNIRTFSDAIKNRVYTNQSGVCRVCGESHELKNMHADHIVPWSKGGKTVEGNCQMLCRTCNLTKSDK